MGSEIKNITIYLFDIRNRNVGLGEVAYQLGYYISQKATALKEKYGVEFTFLVPKKFKGCFGDSVKYRTYRSIFFYKLYYRYIYKADCFHLIHQRTRLRYVRASQHSLMTIHDINFMYEKKGSRLEWYMRRFKENLQNCTNVSYISNFVKSDVESIFTPTSDGCIIYNGVTNLCDIHGGFEKFNLPDNDYLFHISSLMPKKNAHLLLEMMRYLPNEKLVIVGNLTTAYAKDLMEKKKQWNLDNVIMLNHVSNEDKAELYRHCKAFLFPSLCEGFGLPPIEAMHFGKPVFLSTLTSLPEVGGECAYYYDDLSPEKMAKKTSDGLADFLNHKEEKTAKLIERANSFNWEKCVGSYINLYLKILGIDAAK